jgi:probable O-glycosylation ligase (exosortase A-associated)
VLRTIFVLALASVGFAYVFQGPFYALLFYLWIAYFRPETWVWNGGVIQALNLSYVAGLCTVVLVLFSRERFRGGLRVALLGLFLAQTFASTLFGIHTAYAWPFWIEFLKVVVVTYLIGCLANDTDRFRLVLLIIALSLGIEAGKQGWVNLIMHPGAPNPNTHPMLGDNNGVAVGMLMLVPILTTLAATARTRTERYAHRFLALGVLYRGIVTFSRGGFLACAALAFVYVLRSPRRIPALAGIVLAALLIAPILPSSYWQRMDTINASDNPDEADKSTRGRLHFWRIAVDMANAQPFLGVGHNSFNAVYDMYDDSDAEFCHNRSVHSVWFGLLAELGYPGLVLFLAQLVLAFRACSLARRAARSNPKWAVLGRFAFTLEAAFVAYSVGGTFLPFQYNEMYWHLIGLSIALYALARTALASAKADAETDPPLAMPAASFGIAS